MNETKIAAVTGEHDKNKEVGQNHLAPLVEISLEGDIDKAALKEQLSLPGTIIELPAEERNVLQPQDMLRAFIANWTEQEQDLDLLKKVFSKVEVVNRAQFIEAISQIVEKIEQLAEESPVIVLPDMIGESGFKIAAMDVFQPIVSPQSENITFVTADDYYDDDGSEGLNSTEKYPLGSTVVVYDDASYSGARIVTNIKSILNARPDLKFEVMVTAITWRAVEALKAAGISRVYASYYLSTPSDIFSEEEKNMFASYYHSDDVESNWERGSYAVLSIKVPDNFFKPFNFGAETGPDGTELRLLATKGLDL